MAAAYVATGTGAVLTDAGSSVGRISPGKPAGTAQDMALVCFLVGIGLGADGYADPTPPSGWNLAYNAVYYPEANGVYVTFRVYTKVAGSSEPSTYDFDVLLGTDPDNGYFLASARIKAYSGVGLSGGLVDLQISNDLTVTNYQSGSDPLTMDPTTDFSGSPGLLVHFAAALDDDTGFATAVSFSSWTGASSASLAELYEYSVGHDPSGNWGLDGHVSLAIAQVAGYDGTSTGGCGFDTSVIGGALFGRSSFAVLGILASGPDVVTKSFDADALVQDAVTKSFDADALVQDAVDKAFDADALVQDTVDKAFDANALVSGQCNDIDPDGEISAPLGPPNFTGAASRTQCVDDGTRESATPSYADYIYYQNGIASVAFSMSTFTIPVGEAVTSVKLYVHAKTGPGSVGASQVSQLQFFIQVGASIKATSSLYEFIDNTGAWYEVEWTPAIGDVSQADLNDLIAYIALGTDSPSGSTLFNTQVTAVYMHVCTVGIPTDRAFLADALVLDEVTKSFSADAMVIDIFSRSFDADALVVDQLEHSFSADALVVQIYEEVIETVVDLGDYANTPLASFATRCDEYIPACAGIANQFTLSYPVVSPTSTVILRNPKFGNRRVFDASTKIKRTANGYLRVTRKSTWPKIERFMYSFEALTETQRDEFLAFFELTAGVNIKVVDHEACEWEGIIEEKAIKTKQTGRGCQFTLDFTFRGTRL